MFSHSEKGPSWLLDELELPRPYLISDTSALNIFLFPNLKITSQYRIASALTIPAAHSLEMNSLLSHLLSKHFRHSEKLQIEDVKGDKLVEKKSEPANLKNLLSLKLDMYEI